jgi:tetratricopeptide (TPR) repeat protein
MWIRASLAVPAIGIIGLVLWRLQLLRTLRLPGPIEDDVAGGIAALSSDAPTAIELLLQVTGCPFFAVFALAAFCLLATIPALLLLEFWLGGSVTGNTAWLLFGLYGLVLVGVLGPTPMAAKVGMLAVIVVCTLGLPAAFHFGQRQEVRLLVTEQEAAYRQAIVSNPTNAAAYASLADLLYRGGRLEEAIAAMNTAVDISPKTMEAEARRLNVWVAENQQRRKSILLCHHCKAENTNSSPMCVACGQPLAREVLGRLATAMAGGLAVAVGGVFVACFLPSPMNSILIAASLLGGILLVIFNT